MGVFHSRVVATAERAATPRSAAAAARAEAERVAAEDVGLQLYLLLRQLHDSQRGGSGGAHAAVRVAAGAEDDEGADAASAAGGLLARVPERARRQFEARIATVEIVGPDAQLERAPPMRRPCAASPSPSS